MPIPFYEPPGGFGKVAPQFERPVAMPLLSWFPEHEDVVRPTPANPKTADARSEFDEKMRRRYTSGLDYVQPPGRMLFVPVREDERAAELERVSRELSEVTRQLGRVAAILGQVLARAME